jgi:hypothetical protein
MRFGGVRGLFRGAMPANSTTTIPARTLEFHLLKQANKSREAEKHTNQTESNAAMKLPWQRLIRFETVDGIVLRGEPILPHPDFDLGYVTEKDHLQARLIVGEDALDETGATLVSDEVVMVKRILSPLAPSEVPIVRCVGLNYMKHSKGHLEEPANLRPKDGTDRYSPASQKNTASVSIHLLQTPDVDSRPW